MTSQENRNAICPESTIDSANGRNYVKSSSREILGENKGLICESTIESANRRGFIKKASVATAAVALGGLLLGGAGVRLPESSAKSDCSVESCDIVAYTCMIVDNAGTNDGSTGTVYGDPHVLSFGQVTHCPTNHCLQIISGEAIGSDRTSCCHNIYGLDFYTAYKKRMSITNCGSVGIGTCKPSSTLDVIGTISATDLKVDETTGSFCIQSGSNVFVDTCNYCNGNPCGFPTYNYGVLAFGCALSGERIGSQRNSTTYTCFICPAVTYPPGDNLNGLDFYTDSKKRMSITNSGNIGIGTCSPSSTLEVVSSGPSCVPLVAKGASGQTANLQEWENSSGTVFAVINSAGSLGLGGVTKPHHVLCISGKAHASSGFSIGPCVCVNTTLAVNGSMAAKTRAVSSSTTLLTTDYAILASGTLNLTLPPAKTQNGMMIFIKNVSTGTIGVAPGGTDTIEGSSLIRTLPKQYDSLTLISNGTNEWFIQSGVSGGVVIS